MPSYKYQRRYHHSPDSLFVALPILLIFFFWGGVLKYPPNIIMNVILMVRILACGMIPRELILVSLPLINLLSLNGAVFFPIWNPSTEIKKLNYINALSRFTCKAELSKILVFVVNSSSNSRTSDQQCDFAMLRLIVNQWPYFYILAVSRGMWYLMILRYMLK